MRGGVGPPGLVGGREPLMPLASQLGAFQLSGGGSLGLLSGAGGAGTALAPVVSAPAAMAGAPPQWRAAVELVPGALAEGGRGGGFSGRGGGSEEGGRVPCIFCEWQGSVEGFGWHLQAVHKVPEYLARGLVRKRCGGEAGAAGFVAAFCAGGPDPALVPDDCPD